jgi:putative membrane protein
MPMRAFLVGNLPAAVQKNGNLQAIQIIIINKNYTIMEHYLNFKLIIASVLYSFIGIIILVITFVIIELITPENLWKEILEKQNKALAIMASAFMIAMAIIIASAIH